MRHFKDVPSFAIQAHNQKASAAKLCTVISADRWSLQYSSRTESCHSRGTQNEKLGHRWSKLIKYCNPQPQFE